MKLYLSDRERTLPPDHRIIDRTRIREHSTHDPFPYCNFLDFSERVNTIMERRKRKQRRDV